MDSQLDEHALPEDFYNKPNQLISPFFKCLAREMGQGADGPLIKVKDGLKSTFLRSRMGQMFNLTSSQFESVLTKHGGDPGWIGAIEEYGGQSFKEPGVPPSSKLVHSNVSIGGGAALLPKIGGEGERTKKVENTLELELGKTVYQTIRIPRSVLYSPQCADPATEKIKVSPLIDEVCNWIWCMWGKTNIGARLRRQLASELGEVYKMHSDQFDKKLAGRLSLLGRQDAKEYIRNPIEVEEADLCDRALHKINSDPARYSFYEVLQNAKETKFPSPYANYTVEPPPQRARSAETVQSQLMTAAPQQDAGEVVPLSSAGLSGAYALTLAGVDGEDSAGLQVFGAADETPVEDPSQQSAGARPPAPANKDTEKGDDDKEGDGGKGGGPKGGGRKGGEAKGGDDDKGDDDKGDTKGRGGKKGGGGRGRKGTKSAYELAKDENVAENKRKLQEMGLGQLGAQVGDKKQKKSPRVYSAPQTVENDELPPDTCLFKDCDEADDFDISLLEPSTAFKRNQYIAKACKLEDGSWTFFVGRLTAMSKEGPWAKFGNEPEWKQEDISVENYGKLWMFVEPKPVAKPVSARSLLNKTAKEKKVPKIVKPLRQPARVSARAAAKAANEANAALGDAAFEGGDDESEYDHDQLPDDDTDEAQVASTLPPAYVDEYQMSQGDCHDDADVAIEGSGAKGSDAKGADTEDSSDDSDAGGSGAEGDAADTDGQGADGSDDKKRKRSIEEVVDAATAQVNNGNGKTKKTKIAASDSILIIKPEWLEEILNGKDFEIRDRPCTDKIGKHIFLAASGSSMVSASAFVRDCHGPMTEQLWEDTRARHRVPGSRFYGERTYAYELCDVRRETPTKFRRKRGAVIFQTGPGS